MLREDYQGELTREVPISTRVRQRQMEDTEGAARRQRWWEWGMLRETNFSHEKGPAERDDETTRKWARDLW